MKSRPAGAGPVPAGMGDKLRPMILASGSPVGTTLGLAAAAAYALCAGASRGVGERVARAALAAAWLLHGVALAWGLLGGDARFGFAPALSVTVWLVLSVYAVERHLLPKLRARWALAGFGAVAVLLAIVFPGNPQHTALSPWLPLHSALGIASYGLFAAAVLHGWLMLRAEREMRRAAASDAHSGLPLLTLERLTFRFVQAGFVLLSATLLAGWLFGEVLYGRLLRWDHKVVFALASWLVFAVLLLGRAKFGWRGRPAVRVLYVGSALLLLAYVGSRFVLEVVLGRTL